ncbi:hypothetical protein GGR51DRAFT_511938 [Nemania sp. FL0031]|nr:hypothetical protein GGR51DRAFT_511938 [Nemania sp. FL0031]
MPSMQSTLILATVLLGSLLQHATAAPEVSSRAVQYPDCISTCMRNSGCFDSACICKKAADGILSDIVICMNQWCPADVTATDLIEPLESQCSLPKAAVQDAEKKGGVADSGDDASSETTSSTAAKPTTTSTKGGASDVTMTFDVGSPQTAAADASTTTTVKASISGTLTIATEAATTGLLTDGQDEPTTTGSLAAATSTQATSSTSATSASASGTSSDDEDSAAGMRGQASVFGVVAAMGVALALGF